MSIKLNFKALYTILLVIFIAVFCSLNLVSGQSKKSKKTKEEKEWVNNLWYGGGINLGFNADNYSSYFVFGISPLAGYRLNSFISVGPRFSLDWTIAKFNTGFNVLKYNSLDYGLGIFTRFKFLENFFAHLEYSQLNETIGYIDGNMLRKERQWRDIALLGLGYNSNSPFAYEIYINYNFLEDENSIRVPIIYRAGFTYNF